MFLHANAEFPASLSNILYIAFWTSNKIDNTMGSTLNKNANSLTNKVLKKIPRTAQQVGERNKVIFTNFGHIHSVILIWLSEYFSNKQEPLSNEIENKNLFFSWCTIEGGPKDVLHYEYQHEKKF